MHQRESVVAGCTSESQQEQQRRRRSSNFGQEQHVKEDKHEQQTAEWDFRVMTYNILAEGLVSLHKACIVQGFE